MSYICITYCGVCVFIKSKIINARIGILLLFLQKIIKLFFFFQKNAIYVDKDTTCKFSG